MSQEQESDRPATCNDPKAFDAYYMAMDESSIGVSKLVRRMAKKLGLEGFREWMRQTSEYDLHADARRINHE